MRANKWMTGVLAIGLIFGLLAVPAVAEKEPAGFTAQNSTQQVKQTRRMGMVDV